MSFGILSAHKICVLLKDDGKKLWFAFNTQWNWIYGLNAMEFIKIYFVKGFGRV